MFNAIKYVKREKSKKIKIKNKTSNERKIIWIKATLKIKPKLSTIETEFVFCFETKEGKPHFIHNRLKLVNIDC